jgi:putative sugar O-methyltransferase
MYNNYLNICHQAVTEEDMFQKYRSQNAYKGIVETMNIAQGYGFASEIKGRYPYLLKHIKKFATSENIGSPIVYCYPEIGVDMAPTTLRYIKVLGDLLNTFGSLDDINIVEIGVGYGGQCKIIHDIAHPKSYTLVDFPDALLLSQKYLRHFGVDVTLRNVEDESKINYDLCISNYAFSEIARPFQEFYNKNIIQYSAKGYMICNGLSDSSIGKLSTTEILKLKKGGLFLEEVPNTAPRNALYIWK